MEIYLTGPQNQENNLHFTSSVLRIDFAPVEVYKLALHSTSYNDMRIFINEIKKISLGNVINKTMIVHQLIKLAATQNILSIIL